ncbi:Predicted PurR-regulated permease PerM [Paenibacillus catalpae]|uniref:Predicted PurR-regulated permease PerM n=1 Tax=Paenibacillus catalpae TaxID=1045775 RepID=A0A1I1U089_9BACL|nr:AI-2E family transporter [Paenibacillus catalpae]SFD64232.1 Predicted PurR-regulated permease PerM [Paenibacillus catalpae]
METLKTFFAHSIVKRLVFVLLVIVLLYSLRDMLNLLLLLFMVTFVMSRVQSILTKQIRRVIPVSPVVVTSVLYVALIVGLVYGLVNYVPKLINEIVDIVNNVQKFLGSSQNDQIAQVVADTLDKIEYKTYLNSALTYAKKIGSWLEIILLVILLSYFFLLERRKIVQFTEKFSGSSISWLYLEFRYFGGKFIASFGKVLEVQLLIAVINTVLTIAGLWIMGFPYLFALTIMVFLLSLVPVAGVVVSFIPIAIIGYQIGGSTTVIWVIVLVLVIHALETYFLNPRLYAHKTNLPMFYTFFILILSEHYMGIWGLLIGIPIFMFMLDVLKVEQAGSSSEPL